MSRMMMGFPIFLILVFFIGKEVNANAIEECADMSTLESELESLLKLDGVEQLDGLCVHMTEFFRCLNNGVKQETGFELAELADFLEGTDIGKALRLLVNLIGVTEDLCTEGTELREDYIANIECLSGMDNNLQKNCEDEAKETVRAYRELESNMVQPYGRQQGGDHDDLCMVTAYQFGCLGAAVKEECGESAFKVIKDIIRKIGFFKLGVCSTDVMNTLKTSFIDSLEMETSRKDIFRVIFDLKKRRK